MAEMTNPKQDVYDAFFRFKEGDHVRLRDVAPIFYEGLGCTGNEGWIKERRLDKYNYPEVFVQWDKEHWAWNGQPDKWTMEGHFDKIEEDTMSEPKSDGQLAKSLMAVLQNYLNDDAPTDVQPVVNAAQDERNERRRAYTATLEEAIKLASDDDTEAFVLVAVARRPHPDSEAGMLVPLVCAESVSSEAQLLANNELANLAKASHQELTILVARSIMAAREHQQ